MNNFDYEDIKELSQYDPEKPLILHWEGCEQEPILITPSQIMYDIEDGDYTSIDFDESAYCCTIDEYRNES